MYGRIGDIKILDIEIKRDGKTVYNGIGAEVPEEYKVEFKEVKVNNQKIIYNV